MEFGTQYLGSEVHSMESGIQYLGSKVHRMESGIQYQGFEVHNMESEIQYLVIFWKTEKEKEINQTHPLNHSPTHPLTHCGGKGAQELVYL